MKGVKGATLRRSVLTSIYNGEAFAFWRAFEDYSTETVIDFRGMQFFTMDMKTHIEKLQKLVWFLKYYLTST